MDFSVIKHDSLNNAVTDIYGKGVTVVKRTPVSGGDINLAYLLLLSNGERLFLKENKEVKPDFFTKEAIGLSAIESTGTLSVPRVLSCGTDDHYSFLLMEFIESARQTKDFYEDFGYRLSEMHKAGCSSFTEGGSFGFYCDNYIGSGYQSNTPTDTWVEFFRERRLLPQIKRAEKFFNEKELSTLDHLLEKLDSILIEPGKPALLHGDLWSGNFMTGPDGRAWLIDPAVYVGHPEADIAMTELFSGFPKAFYYGYFGENKIPDGYENRRDIYNLYHLLNHLNLFGPSYLPAVLRIVREYS